MVTKNDLNEQMAILSCWLLVTSVCLRVVAYISFSLFLPGVSQLPLLAVVMVEQFWLTRRSLLLALGRLPAFLYKEGMCVPSPCRHHLP